MASDGITEDARYFREKEKIRQRARELYHAATIGQKRHATGWPNLEQSVRDTYELYAQNEPEAEGYYESSRTALDVDRLGLLPKPWEELEDREKVVEIQRWIQRPREMTAAESHEYCLLHPELTDKQRAELVKLIEQELGPHIHMTESRRRNLEELRDMLAPREVTVFRQDLVDLINLVTKYAHTETTSMRQGFDRLKKSVHG